MIDGFDSNLLERKKYYFEKLDQFKLDSQNTKYFKKLVSEVWFNSISDQIRNWNGNNSFGSSTHMIFIEYCFDGIRALSDFEDHYDAILNVIGNDGKRSLTRKFKNLIGPNSPNYYGSAFEILVLGKFAKEGLLIQYEPKMIINTKPRLAEAIVEINNQNYTVEAATVHLVSNISNAFPINQQRMGRLEQKVVKKIQQVEVFGNPILLFLVCPFENVDIDEVRIVLDRMSNKQRVFNNVPIVVVSLRYRSKINMLYCNPNLNIDEVTLKILRAIFSLESL